MSCEHCVKSIKNAVLSIKGVVNVEVSLEQKKVFVEYDKDAVNISDISDAIEDEGYDIV
ncbi:Copper chaperone CopZ [compost metagenome]